MKIQDSAGGFSSGWCVANVEGHLPGGSIFFLAAIRSSYSLIILLASGGAAAPFQSEKNSEFHER